MGMAAWEEDPLDGPGDQIEGPDGDTGGGRSEGQNGQLHACLIFVVCLF